MKEIYKPQTFLSVILNSKNEDTTSLFFRTKAAAFMKNKYAFLLLAFLLFLGGNCSGQTTAIYEVASTTTVTPTGTAPSGSSVSYTQTYTAAKQITKDNSATLTLTGYAGYKITQITLEMKSNTSKGIGTLSVVAGSTTISSVSPTAAFNTASWYGAWSTSYVNVVKTPTAYSIGSGENVVISIAATENSLYIQKYTIVYESVAPCSSPPTTEATNIIATPTTTSTALSWTNGNGTNRAVFVKQTSSGTPSPIDGTTYTANTTFGSGTQIGSSGWYCVYNGTGNSVTISGLTPSTTYRAMVVEYNCSPGSEKYLTNTASDNPNNFTTLTPPANDECSNATDVIVGSTTAGTTTSATLNTLTSEPYAYTSDVWYKVTPTCTGTLTVSTSTSGQDLDIYVFSTSCPSSATSYVIGGNGAATSKTTETTSAFSVTNGTTYYIRIALYGTATGTFNVTVAGTQAQPSVITPPSNLCVGSSATYSVTNITGLTFIWTLPSGWSGTSTSNSISVTPNTTGGTISVAAVGCATSTPRTLITATPVATPTQPNPIVGETSPCPGVEEVYSVDPVAGATSYTWTLPSGWSGSSTTNSITATSGTSGGTISVTANNACGSSTASTLAVTILTTPSAPTATAGTAIDGTSFTANWNSVAGATGYYVDVYTSNPSPTDLFISEYVEGSSNNKYIEIYNGTGTSVNLSNYKLRLFANGAISPTNDITLSGTLADGAVIVYQNSGSTIYAGSTTDNAACNFNGDDAVALYKTTTSSYVDIFGRIGEDPGTAWTAAGGYSTLDKTLVRKSSIISGVSSNPSSGFPTLATEWDLYSQDDVSHLGSHDIVAGKQYVLGYENVYTTSTSLVVTGLSPNTTYYYVVRADNGNCSSPNSNEINVTTTSCAAATHTVTSILPTTGPVGTRVMITGTGFTNVTDITMGGVAVTDFTVLNTTTIIVRIPSGATTNSINIYNSGCPKASPTFTVLISDGNCGAGGAITASDLFISEVYDAEVGSRGYIEIYNGTGAAVNLSSYKLKIYTGATTWVTLSGTLGINQFAVVKIGNSGTNCDATISATGALLINRSTSSGYNKNDYIELYKGTTKIDRVQTPNETGFNLERNTLTGAPSPTFNAANWTLTSTETCSTLGTSSLTSNPLLVINTSPIDNSICPVGSIQFSVAATANPSPVSTYNWYYNNSLDMAGWQLVSGNIASATGTNTATLTLPADFAPLYNYQFYCVVTKSNGGNTCTKYTDAARFIYPTARYYRTKLSTTNGSWTTASEWEMTDDANFVSPTPITACAYPCSANSSAAVIQNGTKTTIGDGIASFTTDIDKLTIENTGTLELHTKSKITVYDSTAAGADIIVNGTLIDRGSTSNGVYFTGSSYTNGSGWILGNAGTIIKTNASSVDDYKTHYQDGISNIPDGSSGAKWTYSYNGDGNPSVNAVGMYYPNLYFENTTGVFHDFITATSLLKGTTDYCTVKGNMFIGTTGSSGVQIYNNNTYSQAMKILGSLSIGSGSSFTNISYNG
ncbi:MAG TPA: lamin tail domain-containing protein, partial [Chitinophagales bacterium]|nr:lamin tail domain-containing protein [Chitinophagales bacterium]